MQSSKRDLLIVLTFAFIVRAAAALYLGDAVSGLSGAQDEISYSMLGHRVATGYGLTFPSQWYPWIEANAPQSYYSATYSLFLGAIYAAFGYLPLIARLITACLSTLIVGMIYLLANHLFGRKVAFLSGLIAAFYAYLIFYGVTLVTETPFILSLMISIYLAYLIADSPSLGLWVALGASLAVSVLLRMAVVFYVPFLILWVVSRQRREWARAIVPLAMIVSAVMPFTIRNYAMWGRFMLLESQFGHVLWNGNHPDQNGNFHPYKVFPIPPEVIASKNDAEITNRLFQMGIDNVARDPRNFALLTITRLREFFKFWPTSDSTLLANTMRVLSFGVLLPFAVFGLFLSRKRWRVLLPIFLFLIVHTAIYSISWTQIRYRIPIDALVIPFAALAVLALAEGAGIINILARRFGIENPKTPIGSAI